MWNRQTADNISGGLGDLAASHEKVLPLYHSYKSITGLAAAISDLQLKTTSGDVACSTVESGTPENMGIAVGISSIAALEPEICWGVILPSRLPGTHWEYGVLCLYGFTWTTRGAWYIVKLKLTKLKLTLTLFLTLTDTGGAVLILTKTINWDCAPYCQYYPVTVNVV